MAEMAILIDVTRCTACRACQVACKEWNQLPGEATTFTGSYQNPPDLSATTWTLVQFRETSDGEGLRWRFRKTQCMHCTDAICHAVCPNDAVTKYPEGNVVINQERCQGCLRCVESCPFQVPHLNPATKKTAKCRGCLDRVTNGLPPACVKTCTSGALQYGLRARLLREAKTRRDNHFPNGVVYGEREMGGLHVLYLLPDRPALYGLLEGLAGSAVLGATLDRVTRFALGRRA
ncbi:MAG TPA: 4Fe-4S dicluster domain-containing protein [Candidatus Methylomirabilis sp.]|jgi:formate dehydrogenase iron-sulfur subunit